MGKGKSFFALVTGAAIGAAAGIGLGLLLAPQKGEKTRKELKERLLKAKDQGQAKLTELADSFKQEVEPVVEKAKAEIEKTKAEVISAVNKATADKPAAKK